MIEIRADGCLVRVAGVVGYQHENNRAQIRFPLDDVLDIVTENPGGSYAVVYKRMFDEQFFTSTDYELDGAYLIWNVSSHVVAVRGELEVQIVYSTDQQIAETQTFHFKVARGLMESEEGQGENLSDLIEQALLAAGTVDQAIYDAQQTLDEKVTAAQTAQTAAEAAQTAAERAQHTAENAKTSAAQSSNAAYNFAADANRAKRDATTAKDDAVQAKTDAENAQEAAENAEDSANTSALKSEGYAVGTQNGTPAGSGEPYYQDNAKYYKEQAAAAKTAAEAARDTAQQTVAGIEAAGTAQVQRVTAEGATQVSNVQTKGQQVLDSIPDDYSELSENVTDLKSAIVEITENRTYNSGFAFGYIPMHMSTIDISNISSSTVAKYIIIDCSEGDVFTLKGTIPNVNTSGLYAFISSDGTVLNRRRTTSNSFITITAPSNTAKLVVMVDSRYAYGLYSGVLLADRVSSVADAVENVQNRFILATSVPGYISATGNISPQGSVTKERTSDFIPITSESITIQLWGNITEWAAQVGLYNSNKEFISRAVLADPKTENGRFSKVYTFPTNTTAAYYRVGVRFYSNGKLMITEYTGSVYPAFKYALEDYVLQSETDEIIRPYLSSLATKKSVMEITGNEDLSDGFAFGYIPMHMSTVDITNINSSSTVKYVVLECQANSVFTLKGTMPAINTAALYAFISADGTMLKRLRNSLTDFTQITAPTNTAYLVVTVDATNDYAIFKGVLLRDKVERINASIGIGLRNPLLLPPKPRCMLHRGAGTVAPENTIPAFEIGAESGVWGLETDVRETTDGYFVLSHDDDVSRMTDGTGKISEMTYAETQECTIDAGANIEQYSNLKMPLLEDYLKICRDSGCVACVEIKKVTHYEDFVNVIRGAGMEGSCVLICYFDETMLQILRDLTSVPICLVYSTPLNANAAIQNAMTFDDLWLDLYSTTVTTEIVKTAHANNIPVNVWTYNNRTDAIGGFKGYGLDLITVAAYP